MDQDLDNEPSSAWSIAKEPSDIVKKTLEKEKLIREIIAAQEDLRALASRVQTVKQDIDKLTSGNAMLQVYIDNLTLQMAKRR